MLESGEIVEECGLILHPDIPDFGASPDGLIGVGRPETWKSSTRTHGRTPNAKERPAKARILYPDAGTDGFALAVTGAIFVS